MEQRDGLPYTAHRVALALRRRPVLAPLAMQYRLCEVGSPRLDPRALERHLVRLCDAREEVVRTAEGLYAAADMGAAERRTLSKSAAAALGDLGLETGGTLIPDRAVAVLKKGLAAGGWEADATPCRARASAATHAARTFQILRPSGAAPLSVLFTHDGNWLYPDEFEMWAHAHEAAVQGMHPLVIARKVAPITYPLLAALNMRALQYFDLLAVEPPTSSTQLIVDRLGLPRIRSVESLATHAVSSQIVRLINERPADRWEPALPLAFADAMQRRFARGAPTPNAIAEWAEGHPELPPRWVAGIRIWADQRERPLREVPSRRRAETKSGPGGPFGRGTQVARVPFRV